VGPDDLPVIRDNIRKGFLETQSKVNSWVQNFKKRLDGEEEDENENRHSSDGYLQSYGDTQTYGRPRRSGDSARRSGDRERYDADPQVLGDDFSALELRDAEGSEWSIYYSFLSLTQYSPSKTRPTIGKRDPFQVFFARKEKGILPGRTTRRDRQYI
jgi:hypothetical protein